MLDNLKEEKFRKYAKNNYKPGLKNIRHPHNKEDDDENHLKSIST